MESSKGEEMKKKYNLALTPLSISNQVINIAKKFEDISDQYLLGAISLPHVTLYQFNALEAEIESIWQQVRKDWKYKNIILTFNEINHSTRDHQIYWVALLPDNQKELHQMHACVAQILGLPIKPTFDPHMTLINTKIHDQIKIIKLFSFYQALTDIFTLSLGKSDDIGQFKEIIYTI
jgi:2'-5' RNA ligase